MRITQGTFSFLPELADDEIRAQIDYALRKGWACSLEYTDDPHPRNTYWEMWGLPMFGLTSADEVMAQVQACREAHPQTYVKFNAFDSMRGVESLALSFIIQRPEREPGFRLVRQEANDRVVRYTLERRSPERREPEAGE